MLGKIKKNGRSNDRSERINKKTKAKRNRLKKDHEF